MIRQAAIATGVLLIAGAAAADGPATLAESAGFKNCVSVAERSARYLRVENTYYINETADSRTYYLNGSGQIAEGAGRIRIACETNATGRKVTAMTVDTGRFVPRLATATDLAVN